MGRIRDFIAKWQDIERPEWEKEVVESKKNIKYITNLEPEHRDIMSEKHDLEKNEVGDRLSVHYSEGSEFEVYLHFPDTEDNTKIFSDKFDSRKDAKDDVEYLMDEYTEMLGK